MVSQPGWTSWTQQARRSSEPCGSSTCVLATASCWCLPLTTGRVSMRWASFSRRSSESRTETIFPSCWLGTRQIWRHNARCPDLKPLPLAPPTMWPTSRPRPNCASMWMRPSSSWCGPSGSIRNKSCRPAHPVPPGRKTEAVPASSCSPGGTRGARARALGTSCPHQGCFPIWVSQDTLHPHPEFLASSRTSPLCAFCQHLPSPPKPLVGVRGSRASGSLLYITPLSTPREINVTANVRKCFLKREKGSGAVGELRAHTGKSLTPPTTIGSRTLSLVGGGVGWDQRSQARCLDPCFTFQQGPFCPFIFGWAFCWDGV